MKTTVMIPALLNLDQIERIARTMLREDPRKRWSDSERRKLARERLMVELDKLIKARWPEAPEAFPNSEEAIFSKGVANREM